MFRLSMKLAIEILRDSREAFSPIFCFFYLIWVDDAYSKGEINILKTP